MSKCPKCNEDVHSKDLFCGHCGFRLFNHNEKISATQQELKVDDVRFNLGVIYLKKNELEKAIDIFSKILDDQPGNSKVNEMLQAAQEKMNGKSKMVL
jgi:hypothetical protein